MLRKYTAGGGVSVAFLIAFALATPAFAGIAMTEREKPAPETTVQFGVNNGDAEWVRFIRDGKEKLVIVEKGSDLLYSDQTNFVKGFEAIYSFAPDVSVLRMKRETEAPGVSVELFAYDALAAQPAESPYAAGSGTYMAGAMIQTLKSVCLINQHKEGCKPSRAKR